MNLLPRHLQRLFAKKRSGKKRLFDSVTLALTLTEPNERAKPEQTIQAEETGQGLTDSPNYSPEFDVFPADPGIRDLWFSLTIREREVAALLCIGYPNYEVAVLLGVEYSTVQTHLQNIFRKFELRSRREVSSALRSWPAEEWWKVHHR